MTGPPTYHFQDLGSQAQAMSRNCNNERVAMILQYVALGSMIIMTGIAASQVLKDVFGVGAGSGPRDRDRGGGRSR